MADNGICDRQEKVQSQLSHFPFSCALLPKTIFVVHPPLSITSANCEPFSHMYPTRTSTIVPSHMLQVTFHFTLLEILLLV